MFRSLKSALYQKICLAGCANVSRTYTTSPGWYGGFTTLALPTSAQYPGQQLSSGIFTIPFPLGCGFTTRRVTVFQSSRIARVIPVLKRIGFISSPQWPIIAVLVLLGNHRGHAVYTRRFQQPSVDIGMVFPFPTAFAAEARPAQILQRHCTSALFADIVFDWCLDIKRMFLAAVLAP